MSNYLAAVTSLDKFISLSGTGKKLPFPYEWLDSFEKLNYVGLPPRKEWYSSLKRKHISNDEWKLAQKIWEDNNMKIFKDYLEYYNNNDIEPFMKSSEFMISFFKDYDLDMFKDGISVPALSLKIVINTALDSFKEYKKKLPSKLDPHIKVDEKIIKNKIQSYLEQDKKAGRVKEKEEIIDRLKLE